MCDPIHRQLPVWERLSYDRDAIIEASAGTGKTYTLQHIVLKLVLERGIPLRKILLVTYTEKAAGELRDRIRGAFEKELEALDRAAPDSREKEEALTKALRHFDEASISTIHSFCQRMLREYAFENGVPMATNVVTTMEDLAVQAVRETLFSDALREELPVDIAAFLSLVAGGRGVDDLIGSLAKALASFRSDRWDRPLESVVGSVPSAPIAETAEALRGALDSRPLIDWARDNHTINARAKAGAERDYAAFELLLPGLLDPDDPEFERCLIVYANLPKSSNYLNPSVNGCGRGTRLLDLQPELSAFLESLDAEVGRRRWKGLKTLFLRSLVRLRELRAEGAYLSYDDMVLQARDALFGERGDLLLEKLRETYKVALVDEFQDTDGIQWDIFRKVFSASPGNPGHFLIVVGDPKQAIYSFRGADLQTYLEARDAISPTRAPGEYETIAASYRSSPGMIDALNDLFLPAPDGTGWFSGTHVDYMPVAYPADNVRFQEDGSAASRLPEPVELLESLPPDADEGAQGGFGNSASCLPVFAENAAREIERLLMGGERSFSVYDESAGGRYRPLRYGDFAFLVRKTNDALPIKEVLRAHGIPYSHYKEAGVYASEEGEAILALLELIADPTRPGKRAAALLSPFFGIPPDRLEGIMQENPPSFTRLLDKWSRLAHDRQWALLFESFVEDTRMWYPQEADDPLYDRRHGTIRQILDDLLIAAGTTAQSAAELAETLRQLRAGDKAAGEDAGLRQKETEDERVQIMTMHAAKGLEFPVVFIAYGFSVDPSPKFKMLAGDGHVPPLAADEDVDSCGLVRRRLFHMDGSPLQKDDYHDPSCLPEENAAGDSAAAHGNSGDLFSDSLERVTYEVRRLLYVALTRAEYKLYLPWSARATAEGIGSKKSPLRGGFLCQAICKHFGVEANAHVLSPGRFEADEDAVAPGHPEGSGEDGSAPTLLPDLPSNLRSRRVRWDSFSSIHHAAGEVGTAPSGPERRQALDGPEKEADEPASTQEEVVADFAPHPTLLPRGTASGTVFHELMECLCNADGTDENPGFEIGNLPFAELFSEGKGAVVLALAERLLRIHGLANREDEASGDTTAKTLVRMAWNALRTSITVGATPFRLADLPPCDRRAEVDFVIDQQAVLGEGPDRHGLFNGSIDLLFRLADRSRYFILDWKTNSLPAYGDAEVRGAMDGAGYHLQYQLYTLAASAWLGADRLAGATYLFVRGGEAGEDGPGIFARTYDETADGAAYRDAVARNLSAARGKEENR